jgi:hypothetical protein
MPETLPLTDEQLKALQVKIEQYFNNPKFEGQWREFQARLKREAMKYEDAAAIFGMPVCLFKKFYAQYLKFAEQHSRLMEEPPSNAVN